MYTYRQYMEMRFHFSDLTHYSTRPQNHHGVLSN